MLNQCFVITPLTTLQYIIIFMFVILLIKGFQRVLAYMLIVMKPRKKYRLNIDVLNILNFIVEMIYNVTHCNMMHE